MWIFNKHAFTQNNSSFTITLPCFPWCTIVGQPKYKNNKIGKILPIFAIYCLIVTLTLVLLQLVTAPMIQMDGVVLVLGVVILLPT